MTNTSPRRRRPTISGIIAFTALVLAVGSGTAVAAKLITSKQIKNNTVKSVDIKNGSVKPTDLAFSVKDGIQGAKGEKGDKGDPGTNGTNGADGAKGADGSAVAYGVLSGMAPGGDSVVEAQSKNLADAQVTHPSAGVYCFNNLSFDPKVVIATVQRQTGGNPASQGLFVETLANTEIPLNGDPCPGSEAASILVFNGGGTLTNPISLNVIME